MQPLHGLTALTALTHLALPCVGRAPGEASRWTSLALEQLYRSLVEGLPGEGRMLSLLLARHALDIRPSHVCLGTLSLAGLQSLDVGDQFAGRSVVPPASEQLTALSCAPARARCVHHTAMFSVRASQKSQHQHAAWRAGVSLGQRLPEWAGLEGLVLRGFWPEVAGLSALRTLLVVLEMRDSVSGVMRHMAHLRAPSPELAPPCGPAPAQLPRSDPASRRRMRSYKVTLDMAEFGRLQGANLLNPEPSRLRGRGAQRAWRTWSCGGRGRARRPQCSWSRSPPRA